MGLLHRCNTLPLLKMDELCGVCGDFQSACYMLYGSICLVCFPCKTFFIRMAKRKKPIVCKNKKNCIIKKETRNQCRGCRYEKCLKVGMKPYLVDLLKHKNIIEENLDHKNPHKEQPKEINLLYPILNMDFTVQFESVHTEIIKNTFQRPEFHSNLLNGIIDLLNR